MREARRVREGDLLGLRRYVRQRHERVEPRLISDDERTGPWPSGLRHTKSPGRRAPRAVADLDSRSRSARSITPSWRAVPVQHVAPGATRNVIPVAACVGAPRRARPHVDDGFIAFHAAMCAAHHRCRAPELRHGWSSYQAISRRAGPRSGRTATLRGAVAGGCEEWDILKVSRGPSGGVSDATSSGVVESGRSARARRVSAASGDADGVQLRPAHANPSRVRSHVESGTSGPSGPSTATVVRSSAPILLCPGRPRWSRSGCPMFTPGRRDASDACSRVPDARQRQQLGSRARASSLASPTISQGATTRKRLRRHGFAPPERLRHRGTCAAARRQQIVATRPRESRSWNGDLPSRNC